MKKRFKKGGYINTTIQKTKQLVNRTSSLALFICFNVSVVFFSCRRFKRSGLAFRLAAGHDYLPPCP